MKRYSRVVFLFLIGLGVALCAGTARAETRKGPLVGYPETFGVTPPLTAIHPAAPSGTAPNRIIPLLKPPSAPRRGAARVQSDPVVQAFAPATLMPSPSLVFDGLSVADDTNSFGFASAPPDTNGDIGPRHYVQFVNTLFRVYDKDTGAPLTVPLRISDLFKSAGLPGPCANTDQGDGIILYDHLADRWMITQFAFEVDSVGDIVAPSYQAFAISQTGDPTGSYFVYCYRMPNGAFNDYSKLGVWPDGYYMTDNQFDLTSFDYLGVGAFAFDRAKMLLGDPLASFIYFDLNTDFPELFSGLPSDLDGPPPPVGTPNRFLFLDFDIDPGNGDGSQLRIFDFHADFDNTNNASFVERGDSPIAVAPFSSNVANILQPDTTDTLDSSSGRLMHRLQYRNFGSYETLVANHTVAADGEGRAGVRYYELRRSFPAGAFGVNEQATFSPDQHSRWMASAAMDGSGNLVIGYSISSGTMYPSIRYAGRRPSDPPGGLFQGEAVLFNGNGSQTDTFERWGDYSSMSVDPSDGCTFWYTNEHIPETGSFNWATKIGKFRFADCTGGLPILTFKSSTVTGGNGNGLIDPNECVNLSVVLTNASGVNEANAVTVSLSTTSPGVVIHNSESYYGGVPAGQSAVNVVPFVISTSKNLPCGKPVDFVLTVKSVESGYYNVAFQLPVAVVITNPPARFDNSSAVLVPDLSTVESSLTVSNLSGMVIGAKAGMFIVHTFDADLTVTLVAPDGTEVELTSHHGGGGDNYGSGCTDPTYTIFDDGAATAIGSGSASFVGSFRPDQPLSSLNGIDPNGVWKLRVNDDAAFDSGILVCWSLTLNTGTCTNGTGSCSPISEVCLGTNSLNFGSQLINTLSAPQNIVLTNCGTGPLVVSNLAVVGDSADFVISSDGCSGGSVAAGGTCTIAVRFLPSDTGARSATLVIEDNSLFGATSFVNLSGNGTVAGFCPSDDVLDFGSQLLNTTSTPLSVLVTNCGTGPLLVTSSSIVGFGAADFQIVGDTCNQQSVAPGGICAVNIVFAPTLEIASDAALILEDNAPGSPHVILLTGVGSGCAGRAIVPQILPSPQLGVPYLATLTVQNGATPITFFRSAGQYPPGLTMDSNGAISGVPSEPGLYSFKVKITDAGSCTAERVYNVRVGCPTITSLPDTLLIGQVGLDYAQALTPSGGTGPYRFSQTAGSLPQGMSLSTNGVLSGTPQSGSTIFTVTITDANDCHGQKTYELTLADPPPFILVGPVVLKEAAQDFAFSQQLTATGGTTPHTFSVTGGALPDGVAMSSAGLLAGTPAVVQEANFTVTATDAAGKKGSRAYKLKVKHGVTDLGVALAQSTATVNEGDEIVYTITVTNYSSSPASNIQVDGFARANLGALAAGATVSVNVKVVATGVGSHTQSVTVSSDEADFTPANNSANIQTKVNARPASSTVEFRGASVLVDAAASAATITVERTGKTDVAGSVGYVTSDGNAHAGVDYSATSGIIGFAAGETSRTISIPLLKNSTAGTRNFNVALRNPSSTIAIGARAQASVTLVKGAAANVFSVKGTNVRLIGAGSVAIAVSADGIEAITVQGADSRSRLTVSGNSLVGATIDVAGNLGSLRAGVLDRVRVSAAGIGSVRVGTLKDSSIAAGFKATNLNAPLGGGAFTGAGTIEAIKIGELAGSTIVAARIGNVKLSTIATDNAGHAFGVMARDSIASVKASRPKFSWNAAGAADQSAGDFHVKR